jgi:prepilin signal peptidase PulO-like enzyme (type II secretory pathway)
MEIFLFVLGAIAASFMGVVSVRLNAGEGFLRGRSRCDACNRPLKPSALVPIISYLFARGRAKCCGARLSIISPISEILLGTLFVLSYASIGLSVALPFFLAAISLLLALVLYDLAHQILPSQLLAIFVLTSALSGYLSVKSFSAFSSSLLTALIISSSLALIHYVSRGRAMGLADAPLAFGLSMLVGSSAVTGFIFSFWIGAIFGIVLLLGRPAGSRMGVEVPFAPYLAAGFLTAHFTQWNLFAIIAALS